MIKMTDKTPQLHWHKLARDLLVLLIVLIPAILSLGYIYENNVFAQGKGDCVNRETKQISPSFQDLVCVEYESYYRENIDYALIAGVLGLVTILWIIFLAFSYDIGRWALKRYITCEQITMDGDNGE